MLCVYTYRLLYELKVVYSLLGLIIFSERRKLQRFFYKREKYLSPYYIDSITTAKTLHNQDHEHLKSVLSSYPFVFSS
jgi:hypothetical protein